MKNVIVAVLVSVIAISCLQGMWINKMCRTYRGQSMEQLEKAIASSIARETSFRCGNPHKDPKHPRIVMKAAKDMSPEEQSRLKGDTLDLESLKQQRIGSNLLEMIVQYSQDAYIEKGQYIKLPVLDSLLRVELHDANIEADCAILLYGRDTTTIINSMGEWQTNKTGMKDTRLFPIGTKGLQFLQVKARIHLSPFLKHMSYMLLSSVLLVLIILVCVAFLAVLIRQKDRLFRQREASVNGTVHDLKTPLNSVITLMSYLKKKLPEPSLQQMVEDTRKQACNLVDDIEALLVTARRDKQRIVLQKEPVDLLQLIGRARESISVQYLGKPHCIQLESEQAEVKLMLDPLYVTNVIRNLLENALKYSDADVRIVMKISKEKSRVLMQVEDNGWGIEKKYQKKIFSQFFQVPREEQGRHRRGYGVGLAYTKYIMEAHGGTIEVESEPGKGSTFVCVFPLK